MVNFAKKAKIEFLGTFWKLCTNGYLNSTKGDPLGQQRGGGGQICITPANTLMSAQLNNSHAHNSQALFNQMTKAKQILG